MQEYQHINGARFCMVYMTVLDTKTNRVKLETFHGVARVLVDRLVLEADGGDLIAVPNSALPNIRKCDGKEPVLKDAVYFVIVKVGRAIPP
jgi:hypothetical protein